MLTLLLALLVASGLPPQIIIPNAAAPDPAVEAALEPIVAAIRDEQAAQALLPPAKDDAERLVRMGRLDQVGRRALAAIPTAGLTRLQANQVRGQALSAMVLIDRENQQALLAMTPPQGWFTRDRYGAEGAHAAFLIAQHADEELWARFVPLMAAYVGTGEIADADYALMYDRLALHQGRPQRYGSQFECQGRRSVVAELEDPDTVDERRAAMGMSTMAENAARFTSFNPCSLNPE